MKSRPIHYQIRPILHLANVVVLTFLLANLVMPAGWVHRAMLVEQQAMADPPPPDWPFGTDFVHDTVESVQTNLFGEPDDPDAPTVFYRTDDVITRTGWYTGVNNDGEGFTLEVISHYVVPIDKESQQLTSSEEQSLEQREVPQQLGLFWGTLYTGMGSMNIQGVTLTYPAEPDLSAQQGFIPMMDWDLMMNYYMPYDPDAEFNYSFAMMAEGAGPLEGCDGGPVLCCQCDNGGVWCPDAIPELCLAKDTMNECLRAAKEQLNYCMMAALATLYVGIKICLKTCPPASPAEAICCLGALAFCAIMYAACLAIYGSQARSCRNVYNLTYDFYEAQACGY